MQYILIVCLFASISVRSQVDKKFDLYILIGQSNMAGRGPLTPELQAAGNERVFMLDKQNQWVLAKHPLHFDKPKVAAAGPGLSFGIAMAEADKTRKIGLVPCAVGGSPIENWSPGAYDSATGTHPYDDAVVRIKAAMKDGVVRGILWHQGESNSRPDRAQAYLDKLAELIQRMRALTGANVPFIAGELGQFRSNYSIINQQLALLPARVPRTGLVRSEGLTHKGDTTHFDGRSAEEFGRRYAVKMLEMRKK